MRSPRSSTLSKGGRNPAYALAAALRRAATRSNQAVSQPSAGSSGWPTLRPKSRKAKRKMSARVKRVVRVESRCGAVV
jgi:hypothetical protein